MHNKKESEQTTEVDLQWPPQQGCRSTVRSHQHISTLMMNKEVSIKTLVLRNYLCDLIIAE